MIQDDGCVLTWCSLSANTKHTHFLYTNDHNKENPPPRSLTFARSNCSFNFRRLNGLYVNSKTYEYKKRWFHLEKCQDNSTLFGTVKLNEVHLKSSKQNHISQLKKVSSTHHTREIRRQHHKHLPWTITLFFLFSAYSTQNINCKLDQFAKLSTTIKIGSIIQTFSYALVIKFNTSNTSTKQAGINRTTNTI